MGDDAKTTDEDVAVSGTITGTDVDGDVLTYGKGTDPSHGTVVVNADGTYTYTPNANFHGSDSFTVSVSDGKGGVTTATVTITVNSINDIPVVGNDNFLVDEKALLTGTVATNDQISGDGGNIFTVTVQSQHGDVVMNSDGSFTYTQKGAYFGNDTFTYSLCDANGDCVTAIASIIITHISSSNHAPVAADDRASTKGDLPVAIAVLSNDTDSDGTLITNTLVVLDQPKNGTAVVNANGTITYTANKGYVGEDSFSYRICDSGNPQMCATATAIVTVVGMDVKVPDAFSPNGDGINDSFVIKGLESYPNNVLRIFNRWGNVVFTMKGYDNTWNGVNGGKGLHIGTDLPDGTYYYIIDLGDGSKPQSSYIVIKR